jgi:hypothetical protein
MRVRVPRRWRLYRPRAAQVRGPGMPSTVSRWRRWKMRTAAIVVRADDPVDRARVEAATLQRDLQRGDP